MRKIKKHVYLINRLIKDLFSNHIIMLALLFCFIITAAIATVIPKITGETMTEIYNQLINKIALNGVMDFTKIYLLLICLSILYITNSVLGYIKNIVVINICQGFVSKLRNRINEKVLRLPIRIINERSNGEIMSLLTNDMENISTHLSRIIREVISEFLTIIGACIMLFTISPKLIVINIIVIIVSFMIILIARHSKKYYYNRQKEISDLNNKVEELYGNRLTIKMYNKENYVKEDFKRNSKRLRYTAIKAEFLASIAGSMLKFTENIAITIITIASAILNIKGEIKIGYIYTIISYTKTTTEPLNRIGDIINEIISVIASLNRVYIFLDEEENEKQALIAYNGLKDKILAKEVSFSYDKKIDVLKNINVMIPKGKKIAIVGKTGSGKTTLVKLLMNIYSADNGIIESDNNDVNMFDNEKYLKNFGFISQDINLFSDTVIENIKYGNEKISEEEIIKIAKEIGVDDIFSNLENGYNTQIAENDNHISSGVKQIIALMQNIISDAEILILDEATNMLDKDVENKIKRAINFICENKTVIIIAHNIETIKDADNIYVVNNGRIVECGTHEELIKLGNVYAKMYNN